MCRYINTSLNAGNKIYQCPLLGLKDDTGNSIRTMTFGNVNYPRGRNYSNLS